MANPEHLRILKGGVEEWNAWRVENPEIDPDLTGANLRGMNLKGTHFQNADFSGANISGANFIGANLEHANFTNSRTAHGRGVPIGAAISIIENLFTGGFLGTVAWFFALSIYIAARELIIYFTGCQLQQLYICTTIAIYTIASILFVILINKQRFNKVFGTAVMLAMVWAILSIVVLVDVMFSTGVLSSSEALQSSEVANSTEVLPSAEAWHETETETGSMLGFVLNALAFVISVALVVALAVALAALVAVAFSVALVGGIIEVGNLAIALTFFGAAGCVVFMVAVNDKVVVDEAMAVALAAIIQVFLSFYITWLTIREDEQFLSIKKYSFILASVTKTRFQSAVLTGANFSGAFLRGVSFDAGTNLKYTRWKNAEKMHLAFFFDTPLKNKKVRNLLVALDRNTETDFNGVNLQNTHLVGSALREADLRNSDLDGADLSHSDITGAKLYATSRENWEIEGIKCEYVYWDEEGKERMPPGRDFEPGEFEKLYKQLPTFDYFFEGNFTPIDMVIMDRVVQAINDKHPEFELNLDSFSSRSNPHAKFTVFHKEDTETAYHEIKAQYEARIAALEHDKEKLFALTQTLVDNPRQINQYYMQIEGDVIDIDAQKNVAYAKNQSKSEITDGE